MPSASKGRASKNKTASKRRDMELEIAQIKEMMARLEQEKKDSEDRLQEANKKIQALETAAARGHDAGSSEQQGNKLIPRPVEKSFSLEKASGWEREVYLAFRRDIRRLIIEAQIKYVRDFRIVDHKKLGLVYKGAYAIYPSLKKFKDNWFLDVAACRTLQNRRRGVRRAQKRAQAAASSADESHSESDGDEDMD